MANGDLSVGTIESLKRGLFWRVFKAAIEEEERHGEAKLDNLPARIETIAKKLLEPCKELSKDYDL